LRSLLTRGKRSNDKLPEADQMSIRRVTWSVRTISRWVPAASCLTQALATQALLASLGQRAYLRIAVARGKEEQLQAHAWVESQGRIVIGHLADLSRFTVLSPSREKTS
jgi:transglutaminase superfamily protein